MIIKKEIGRNEILSVTLKIPFLPNSQVSSKTLKACNHCLKTNIAIFFLKKKFYSSPDEKESTKLIT